MTVSAWRFAPGAPPRPCAAEPALDERSSSRAALRSATSRAPAATLLVALGLGAALRLGLAATAPATFDEVSFLAALERWDLLAFEPHFPGYPLTVLLARVAAWLGASAPYTALATLLLVPACAAVFAALGRGWGGAAAGGLLALSPLSVAEASRPMADATATALLALGLAAAWRALRGGGAAALAAGLLLGLAAAAKPDLGLFLHAAPVAGLAGPAPGRVRRAALGALGALAPVVLAAWALAAGAGGVLPLVHEARRFTRGHVSDWGGGVAAAAGEHGLRRPARAVAPLLLSPGGASAPALVSGGLLVLVALRAPRGARRAAVVATLPYGLWHLLGQNLEHPRHALPLLPPLALLAGLALARWPARRAAPAALLLLLGAALGAPRGEHAGFERLAERLDREDLTSLRVYGGASVRPLRWRLAGLDARRARSVDQAREDLAADPCPPARVWVLLEVPGAGALPTAGALDDALRELARVDRGR